LATSLPLEILPQPDETTCGPTCLHAVYRYYGDDITLDDVVAQTGTVEGGGTLAVLLACHALQRGYSATIYTYNLSIFDPSWFGDDAAPIDERLRAQAQVKHDAKLAQATEGYLEYLSLGGRLRFEDLTAELIQGPLRRGAPVLTGLSATYLYRCKREYGPTGDYDDIRGRPTGHFVVLCGYDPERRTARVADPLQDNPTLQPHIYEEPIDRIVASILLGVLTYDANLLVIDPPGATGGDAST